MKKHFFLGFIIANFLILSAFSAEMTIYQKGKIIPSLKNTSGETKNSGKILAEYFTKCTGEKLSASGLPQIRLEISAEPEKDPESFEISFPDAKTIIIKAPSAYGLENAVNEFIEQAFGVRWLFPGKDGEYIPSKTKITMPAKTIKAVPAFLIRNFAMDHSRKEDYVWGAHNKLTFAQIRTLPGRIWFQHNLFNLVPQSLYGKTNPEFYPILNGKRFIPQNGFNIYWQPCFSAANLPEIMAKHVEIMAKREANVSLGVNDGANHCQCAVCLKTDGKTRNCFGFINRSKSYLQCMNKIAEICAKPGRNFGFSAYDAIAEPPDNLKLNPALIPMMTYSRMNWIDPIRRKRDQELTRRWYKLTGNNIGWYDYFQQKYFLIPPVYFHLFGEYIRWGNKNNVKYYYTEINRSDDWHSGPMNYLVAKLLWNPDLDVDRILNEWYVCAVGTAAAPYLAEYFKICEDYWTHDIAKTKWFYPERQFMANGSPDYLEKFDFTKLDKMLKLLEKVNRLSGGKPYAKLLLDGFKKRLPNFKTFEKNLKLEKSLSNQKFKVVFAEDFSDNRQSWIPWQREISKGKFSASGEGSLKMDMLNSHKDMVLMKDITVVPGKIYRATADVKMVGLDNGAEVFVTTGWLNDRKKWLDSSYNATKKLEEDFSFAWKTITVNVMAPDIPGVKMRLMLNANKSTKGVVLWDNVKLEEAE